MRIRWLCVALLAAGCDSGVGIGGASYDPPHSVAEVTDYEKFIAPQLREDVLRNACSGRSKETWAGISQHQEDIFHAFSFRIDRLETEYQPIPNLGLSAWFGLRTFILKTDGRTLVEESLPSVFVMHPMRLGVDNLGGQPVVMVLNSSRATTGRKFVAIYAKDGTPLYRNVLITWQVWDVARDQNHIDIVGCGETRRITWSDRPNTTPHADAANARKAKSTPPAPASGGRER